MIVAGLQIDIEWESPDENISRAEALAARAVAAGARLLVLPEMFATGFSMHTETTLAAADASRECLSRLARRHQVWVMGGHVEAGEPLPYNALTIMSPEGEAVLCYRKIHPFSLAGEHNSYAGGDTIYGITIEGVRITPVICYDLRFTELFRPCAETTDLFVIVANWPEKRGDAWRTLLRARAMDNQAYVLGVNRVGTAQGLHHRGSSALIDANGTVISMVAERPGVLLGEVDPDHVRRWRRKLSFLTDRRPEIYQQLVKQDRDPV